MDDFALSEANLRKLKHLAPGSSENEDIEAPDLARAAKSLSEAKTKEACTTPRSRACHDETLRVYACLCRLHSREDREDAVDNKVNLGDGDGPARSSASLLANTSVLDGLDKSLIASGLPIFPADLGIHRNQNSEPDHSKCRLIAEATLASLALISRLRADIAPSNQDLLSIAAYAEASDPWSSEHSARYAGLLLKQYLPSEEKRFDVIVKTLLQNTLRPLFSRPSSRLTASGRPSQYDQPTVSPYDRSHHHHEVPEWKKKGCFVISTFRYAIKSDSGLIAKHWPLYLPVLVALAEDDATVVRVHGLQIMQLFLDACPPNIIRSTGIGNVFRDAVFPTLLFLPSLTPESDSIRLLRPAYGVLLKLARMEPAFPNPQKQKLLDKMIRDGVLTGYTHASQHVRIVEVLMEAVEAIVDCMGVYAVKHLQAIVIQTISPVLTDPFAILYPPTIISAAKALDMILVRCWPRSSEYTEPVVGTIARCWLNVAEEEEVEEVADSDHPSVTIASSSKLSDQDRAEIRQHLLKIAKTLHSMWRQQGREPPQQLQSIVQAEPQLGELLLGHS